MSNDLQNEVFLFASTRRHTSTQGDWSSDVCASDLQALVIESGSKIKGGGIDHQRARVASGAEKLANHFVLSDRLGSGDFYGIVDRRADGDVRQQRRDIV